MKRTSVSFDLSSGWTLSVPPQLSSKAVGELNNYDIVTTNWYSEDEGVTIDRVPGVTHQALIEFLDYGERKVFAATPSQNILYQFELEVIGLEIKHVPFPFALKDSHYHLGLGRWSGMRFNNKNLARVARSSSEIEHVLIENWEKVKTNDLSFFLRSSHLVGVTHTPYFDDYRQFLWVHNAHEDHLFYLFIFDVRATIVHVGQFGDTALLQFEGMRDKEVSWRNPHGRVYTQVSNSILAVPIMLPKHLGIYTAELNITGEPFNVIFDVRLRWPYSVPRDYIQRGGLLEYDSKDGEWPEIVGVHIDDKESYSYLPGHGNVGHLTHYQSLRLREEFPFFRALVRSFAKWYFVDVQNYAYAFPYALRYCRAAQSILDEYSDRVGIVDEKLSDDLSQLLPSHLNPPLLMLRLDIDDQESSNAPAAFVVYDPVYDGWRNIMVFDQDQAMDLPRSWIIPFDDNTRQELHESYTHYSPAYADGMFSDELERVEELFGGANAKLATAYKRDRIYYSEVRKTLSLEPTKIDEYWKSVHVQLLEERQRILDSIDMVVTWETAVVFEDNMKELINYMFYIREQCIKYNDIIDDADNDEFSYYQNNFNLAAPSGDAAITASNSLREFTRTRLAPNDVNLFSEDFVPLIKNVINSAREEYRLSYVYAPDRVFRLVLDVLA